jgi:toxin FitB
MMNLVDSSGWLEFFADGPDANEFSKPLTDIENLIVPSISVFEVFKVVLRERDEEAALMAASLMKQGNVIDLNFEIAIQAAKTATDHKIPMADSIILTTAILNNAMVWTQDSDFKGLANVKYFPKLKS